MQLEPPLSYVKSDVPPKTFTFEISSVLFTAISVCVTIKLYVHGNFLKFLLVQTETDRLATTGFAGTVRNVANFRRRVRVSVEF